MTWRARIYGYKARMAVSFSDGIGKGEMMYLPKRPTVERNTIA